MHSRGRKFVSMRSRVPDEGDTRATAFFNPRQAIEYTECHVIYDTNGVRQSLWLKISQKWMNERTNERKSSIGEVLSFRRERRGEEKLGTWKIGKFLKYIFFARSEKIRAFKIFVSQQRNAFQFIKFMRDLFSSLARERQCLQLWNSIFIRVSDLKFLPPMRKPRGQFTV